MEKSRVLIIDDEKDFLMLAKLNLEQSGKYEVRVLSSAKEMLDLVHTFKPDVILMDLVMPNIGGLEACEMLNNDSLGKVIPIIVLSGLDKTVDKVKAYKLGIEDYLTKPIDSILLSEKIERVLQIKRDEEC
jgi:CheY-like chemotaxis protein